MSAYSDLYSGEFIGSQFHDDIFESILSTMASFYPKSYLPKFHINIIRYDKDVRSWIKFIETREWGNRISGKIHIGYRFHESYLFSSGSSFRYQSMKLRVLPVWKSKTLSKHVNHEKPNIMSGICILRARISESDDTLHNSKSIEFRQFVKKSCLTSPTFPYLSIFLEKKTCKLFDFTLMNMLHFLEFTHIYRGFEISEPALITS